MNVSLRRYLFAKQCYLSVKPLLYVGGCSCCELNHDRGWSENRVHTRLRKGTTFDWLSPRAWPPSIPSLTDRPRGCSRKYCISHGIRALVHCWLLSTLNKQSKSRRNRLMDRRLCTLSTCEGFVVQCFSLTYFPPCTGQHAISWQYLCWKLT